MPAQLVSLNDGPLILLDKPILLLGRHPECDVQIESRKISRRHCCIAQISDFLVVRDLGSTNGVRINGVRVLEGKLAPGDELTIGTFRYRVVWESMSRVPIAAARPPSAPVVPMPVDDDDLLEACDEPVPLPDPSPPVGKPHPPPAVSAPPARTNPSLDEPFILPEQLELLPKSDVFQRPPSPQPPAY